MYVKINRNQLRYLLYIIKSCVNEVYLFFKKDKVEFSYNDRETITVIKINYESYSFDKEICITINPKLLFDEIEKLPKNEFIKLSTITEDNLMNVESVDV